MRYQRDESSEAAGACLGIGCIGVWLVYLALIAGIVGLVFVILLRVAF